MIVTALLCLTGAAIACIVVASLALGARLGRAYVFTAPGVSRLGPRVGRRIAATKFVYQGTKVPLRRVLSPDHLTLLIFLGGLGGDTSQQAVMERILLALLRFVRLADDNIEVLVFCTAAVGEIDRLLGAASHFKTITIPNDDMTTTLGIRVMPYALLVDKDGRVLEKGLVNHLEHLCLLVARGGLGRSDEGALGRFRSRCESHLANHTIPHRVATEAAD